MSKRLEDEPVCGINKEQEDMERYYILDRKLNAIYEKLLDIQMRMEDEYRDKRIAQLNDKKREVEYEEESIRDSANTRYERLDKALDHFKKGSW